jgi:hypothetical protein
MLHIQMHEAKAQRRVQEEAALEERRQGWPVARLDRR